MLSSTEIIGEYVEFIYCACGCKKTRSKNSKHRKGQDTRFIIGHARKGKSNSEGHNQIIRNSQTGKNNSVWKGDDVGYTSLHQWIWRNFPKPEDGLCMLCHQVPFKEAANITGILNREFKNWAWFCHKCHKHYDNIAARAWVTKRKKEEITT